MLICKIVWHNFHLVSHCTEIFCPSKKNKQFSCSCNNKKMYICVFLWPNKLKISSYSFVQTTFRNDVIWTVLMRNQNLFQKGERLPFLSLCLFVQREWNIKVLVFRIQIIYVVDLESTAFAMIYQQNLQHNFIVSLSSSEVTN